MVQLWAENKEKILQLKLCDNLLRLEGNTKNTAVFIQNDFRPLGSGYSPSNRNSSEATNSV